MDFKYPSSSPYVYCANNPLLLIDPDGKDWYVNGETGEALFVKDAVGDLNEEQIEQYGSGWNHFGANDMFGDDIVYAGTNILENNSVKFSIGAAQDFMYQQCYDKANDFTIEETKVIDTFSEKPGMKIGSTQSKEKITDQQITFSKPENLNTKTKIATNLPLKGFGGEIRTTIYNVRKPWGQGYETKSSGSSRNASENIFKYLIPKILKSLKKR